MSYSIGAPRYGLSGTRQFLYIDGECVDNIIGVTGKNMPRDTTKNITIGGVVGGSWDYFNGKIDEVRILNRAQDAQWIRLCI
jgi:Concanavalin A-like lectin/glucanases superfamily